MDFDALNAFGTHLIMVKEVLLHLTELVAVAHVVCAFPDTVVGQKARSSLRELCFSSSEIHCSRIILQTGKTVGWSSGS
ncbi:hypothetical protein LguiB_027466 [Lonicera macranthoides]